MGIAGRGQALCGLVETELVDHDQEKMLGIHGSVSVDGDIADFVVSYKDRAPHNVAVPFAAMGPLYHEVRCAARLMLYRQRLKMDRGAESMMELLETALRPATIEFEIDDTTGDRFMILQFSEHMPLVLRMSQAQIHDALGKLKECVARSAN